MAEFRHNDKLVYKETFKKGDDGAFWFNGELIMSWHDGKVDNFSHIRNGKKENLWNPDKLRELSNKIKEAW